jgi:predicted MFS family arabinose efflux permease
MTGGDSRRRASGRPGYDGRAAPNGRAAAPAEPPPTLRAWYTLAVLLLLNIFGYVDRVVPSILMESIRKTLPLSDTQIGVIGGLVFTLTYSVAAIPLARVADRTSRRRLIAISAFVWSTLTACSGLAGSFLQLAGSRIGVALGESVLVPAGTAMIADLFPERFRRRAIATFLVGGSIGVMAGLSIGGSLNALLNWRATFYVCAIPGALLGLVLLTTVREPTSQSPPLTVAQVDAAGLWQTARRMWRLKVFRHLLMAVSLYMFASYSVYQFGPIYLIRTYGLSSAGAGAGFGLVMGGTGVIGTLIGAYVTDKLSTRDPRWSMWVPAIALAAATPVFLCALSAPTAQLMLLMLAVPNLVVFSFLAPSVALTQALATPQTRALFVAVLTFAMYGVGSSIGPLFVGVVSDALRPRVGPDSLHAALTMAIFGYAWSGFHYWRASRLLPAQILFPATA